MSNRRDGLYARTFAVDFCTCYDHTVLFPFLSEDEISSDSIGKEYFTKKSSPLFTLLLI